MYLDERRHELAEATLLSHGYRLTQFVQWCDDQGIDNLTVISGRDIHRFRVERREVVRRLTLLLYQERLKISQRGLLVSKIVETIRIPRPVRYFLLESSQIGKWGNDSTSFNHCGHSQINHWPNW